MTTRIQYAVLALTVATLVLLPAAAGASNEIAETEELACTVCHDKPGSKLLTDEGKYYELFSTLDGHAELEANFGQCTTCHVRKPGSLKLTKRGESFRWMIQDMEGLRMLLTDYHPKSFGDEPAEEEATGTADGD